MERRTLSQVLAVAAAVVMAGAGCASRTVRGQRPEVGAGAPAAAGPATASDVGAHPHAAAHSHAAASAPQPQQMRIEVSAELDNIVPANDPKQQKTEIALVLTDQTGSSRRAELGIFNGACNDVTAGADDAIPGEKNIVAVDCFQHGSGVRLRIVRRNGNLIILRADVDPTTVEPAYNEMRRVPVPAGAAVRGQNEPK